MVILSTVAGIVKSHGGFLKLYSEPRHTSFSVFLPARIAADEGKVIEADMLAPKGHGEIIWSSTTNPTFARSRNSS